MEERIRYLFNRYLTNECTREEFDEWMDLMLSATSQPLIRELMHNAYQNRPEDPETGSYLVDSEGKLLSEEASQSAGTRKRVRVSVAAMVALIVVSATWWMVKDQKGQDDVRGRSVDDIVIKSTERSEYKYILLPDSTQVWLNAASSLVFPEGFGEGLREVELSGEAYFDVKHADKIPFVIKTGNVSTVVLGTAFNICAYPDLDKVIVSVKRGKVRVEYKNRKVAMLTQGQQATVGKMDSIVTAKTVRPEVAAAWQEGNLVYDDYPMENIIKDLERVYNVRLEIRDPAISRMRLSTAFRRDQGIEPALEVLCRLTDSGFKLVNGIYLIESQ